MHVRHDEPTQGSGKYSISGVDEEREQAAFSSVMRPWLEKTKIVNKRVKILAGVASGHFATVLQIDPVRQNNPKLPGPRIAITTDGVGTKILVARAAKRYESIGIDCVANNVNDLVCIGADPVVMLDYIAINIADEDVLGAIAHGLAQGADTAGIAIPGGEIAQVGAMLASAEEDDLGPMFDLVGTALGLLPPEEDGKGAKILDGSEVKPGDVIVGLSSSGLHSNGYSLARHALFEAGGHALEDLVPGLSRTIADELLEPTRIYAPAIRALWAAEHEVHGLVNISGGGLLNLLRLPSAVAYRIESVPEPQAIFQLIAQSGEIDDAEMYATFNMGVGACIVVPENSVDAVVTSLQSSGEAPTVLGVVVGSTDRFIDVVPKGLRGRGDRFTAIEG